jgi:hypothetical protein
MSIQFQVQNISTGMTDQEVQSALTAVQAQVAEDVAPIWANQTAAFTLISNGSAFTPGCWRFIVADTPAQVGQNVSGAAGDHDAEGGAPTGYAFVQVTQNAGMDVNVTISHEILEMIGDSLIDQCNQWSDLPNPSFLAQELCDPVEDDSLAYTKGGTKVSNFVTPAYFIPGSAGPWDFLGKLTAPNSLTAGGYQLVWEPTNGWQQHFPQNNATGRAAPGFATRYSRRLRRIIKARTRGVLAAHARSLAAAQ